MHEFHVLLSSYDQLRKVHFQNRRHQLFQFLQKTNRVNFLIEKQNKKIISDNCLYLFLSNGHVQVNGTFTLETVQKNKNLVMNLLSLVKYTDEIRDDFQQFYNNPGSQLASCGVSSLSIRFK